MWNDLGFVEKTSKRVTWFTVVLAFLSGLAGLAAMIQTLSKVTTWLAVIFAFLSGITGIMVVVANKRKEALEDAFKRTPPHIEVAIETGKEDEKFYVIIKPRNKVPFECQWLIVTQNNQVISGVPLDWVKIFPNDKYPFFQHCENINLNSVLYNYIELRFSYRSIYAPELKNSNLSGELIRRYKLSPDKKFCIPLENDIYANVT